VRDIERALGDGIKKVYPSEMGARTKLRRVRGEFDGTRILADRRG
jgi:hypothetical protein